MIVTLICSVIFLAEVWFDLCFDVRISLFGEEAEQSAFTYYRTVLGSPHVTALNTLAVPFAFREALSVLAAVAASTPARSPWRAFLNFAALTAQHAGCLEPWGWTTPQPVPGRLLALATRITTINFICGFSYLVICVVFYVPMVLAASFDRQCFSSWWVVVYFRILIILCYTHHVLGCAAWLHTEIRASRGRCAPE
mmetsp:Transcript_83673/g.249709  ORF Transcript_83673/g.249709 Transcript_83673/m.249709 type:complete len:196 (-) Transcript_83673:8-595(-)